MIPGAISPQGDVGYDDHVAISEFLGACVSRGDVPALVAAVVGVESLLYIGAFGKRDVSRDVEATPDTIFRIASMTKPITSLAVMMLVESGRVGLDDPVATYLPDYEQPPVLTGFDPATGAYKSRPASRAITVRDLLTHTSGIAYPFLDPALGKLSAAGAPTLALPLLHDPGGSWTYGPGTVLLGRLVAAVEGGTLDDFCQTRIFDPLGMVDTGYAVPHSKHHRVATLHQRDGSGGTAERPNPPAVASRGRGDDGLFSTACDYAAFMQVFLNGGRRGTTQLVTERTIRMMTTNQIDGLVVRPVASRDRALWARPFPAGAGKDKFGFGFAIETPPSEPGLRTPGSLSWAGIFNTYFWIDPARRIAAVVLMQLLPAGDEKVVELLGGFERRVYQQFC